jgi:excisionase family DNA binding protein
MLVYRCFFLRILRRSIGIKPVERLFFGPSGLEVAMQKYLTIPEVREILGLKTDKAVRLKVARRELPFVRLGRLIRIPSVELEKYLSGLTGCDAAEASARIEERAA